MAVAVVTFAGGTRVNVADNNSNWANLPAGGPAPAAEAQNAYQNAVAINQKITNSAALDGIVYDPGASALDMTAAANKLWFVKIYVADFGDLNTTYGVSALIGSSLTDYYHYNLAGSGSNLSVFNTYPAQGGYILTAIDPEIATWREGTVGTPVLTTVDFFGGQSRFVVGAAKSENFAVDAIDVGTGLTITAGDGASTEGNFTDFVAADQDTIANRWGVCAGVGTVVEAWGLLTIGSASVTEFLDNTSTVIFRDGYWSRGLVGVFVNAGHASSIFNIGCLMIGQGTRNGVDAEDTRPDLDFTGALGTYNFTGTLVNFRDVSFPAHCHVDGADIECHLLTQNSCDIDGDTVIRTNALTSVACLQDPTLGTTTDLHDAEFIQTGAGHAILFPTASNFTLTNLTFTGYGAIASDDAALDLTDTTGTYNITISGGSTPTYKTGGATVNILTSVPLDWEVVDKDNVAISGAQITAFLVSDDSSIITATDTDGSGLVSDTYTASTPVDFYYRVRKSSTGATKYILFSAFGTIAANTGFSAKVTLIEDTNNAT